MVHVKNYETLSKFVTVVQRKQ